MDKEIWKDVSGYEGLYQVSNLGRVKSLNYKRTWKAEILSPGNDGWGYTFVYLYKEGERKRYKVHRLVLSTFNPIENMENLDCNHLDENKENNHLSNLQWTTRKDNVNYGTRNDRVSKAMKGKKNHMFCKHSENTKQKISEANSIPVVQIDASTNKIVNVWKSSHDAAREGGYNQGNINSCCKNKYMREGNNIYKGFRWMYLSEYMDKNCGIIE